MQVQRVIETGEPVLVQAEASVAAHGQAVLSRQLVVTNHDIDCLVAALRDLVSGVQPEFELQTLECSAIVSGRTGQEVAGGQPHAAVSLWVGEPYRLMRGIRLMAGFDDIAGFCNALQQELAEMLQRHPG